MSVVLYTGTPGSGKSLHAAHDIRYCLDKPRGEMQPVIANFEVNTSGVRRPEAFMCVENNELSPAFLTDFAEDFWTNADRRFSEDYILLVLDECQLVFNSRNWMDKGRGRGDSRMDWLEFLSQHRKYGYKVVLIAQSSKMIDNQFRMLCEYEINHRKVAHMGMVGAGISAIFRGRLFMRVKYLFQTNERLGMQLALGHKRDMVMYDTYAKLRKL